MEGEGKGIGRDEKGKVRREEGKEPPLNVRFLRCACGQPDRVTDRQTDRHATVPLNRC